ncbi:MAG: beta-L-arabinofuranosidase domain-containing protein [Terracidiphilus sp.]
MKETPTDMGNAREAAAETGSNLAENEMNRREFIRLALMSSAMLMGSSRLLEGAEPDSMTHSYAALHALVPGAIQPDGWLRLYMEKQASQLGSQLPHVSWPFTAAYWAGEEQAESWWPWEQKAYWLDGATRLAVVLQDERLMAQVRESIYYTLTHTDAEGYLGPKNFEDPKEDFHRWPQNVLFRGLAALGDAHPVPGGADSVNIADAMRKHYLSDKASYGTPTRNVTNIEAMLWCYRRTGDPRLLELAEKSWKEYMTVAADPDHGDLSELRVYAATPINAHGCTYAETMKLPAILYLNTGKEDYLKFAQAAERRIFDHHMLIDGIPSTSEWYRTRTSLDSHETCDISDHTWSWGYMLMATGDAIWADRIERACFNAAPGAIKNDWKALQYFSCPNQFLATLNSDHNVMEHGGRMMAYQPNPGQNTACCGGNVHRIFPNYAIRMWMKTDDNGLAAVLYGPSKIKAVAGPEQQEIEIVQTTSYPFDERIHLKINTDRPVEFPLSLRIPAWCDAPRLTLNGVAASTTRTEKGFVVLHRKFKPGDEVILILPMKVAVTHWPQNGMGIEHGPLVYALPIKENWTSKIEPKYTTADFPSWEATPASAWNYGIAVDPAKLDGEVKFERGSAAEDEAFDPWENPRTTLTVPVRKIEDWDLQTNPDNANQKFTPPLPDLSVSKVSEKVERVTLVPYGSTQLRVTIFPAVRG